MLRTKSGACAIDDRTMLKITAYGPLPSHLRHDRFVKATPLAAVRAAMILVLVALIVSGFGNNANAQTIVTFAGNGTAAFAGDGGAATAAELHSPSGAVAIDGSGNVYIADNNNFRVRVVNASGVIGTYAGNGTQGHTGDGGAATAAELNYVGSMAIDASGNLYIVDQGNHNVRIVYPSGTISTFAGSPTASSGSTGDGGPASTALLNGPTGACFDGAGNMYIADGGNSKIRIINSSGTIGTFAGNGTANYSGDGNAATNAEINSPYSVAIDAGGNIYVGDYSNQRIRKINTSQVISTVAGTGTAGFSGDGAAATLAKLSNPPGVTVDRYGNIFIADQANYRIRMVNPSGKIGTYCGNSTSGYSGDGGAASAAELKSPQGVYVDGSGNLYINDQTGERVRKIGNCVSGTTTVCVASTTTLSCPYSGASWGSGNTAVATVVASTGVVTGVSAGTAIISFTATGGYVFGTTITVLANPAPSVTPTSASICSGSSASLTASGSVSYTWAPSIGLTSTNTSSVYASPPSTIIYTVTGTNSSGCTRGATVMVTEATTPTAITGAGSGIISTIAGNGTAGFSGNGTAATAALLGNPANLVVDASGNIYFADLGSNVVRKINTSGVITTVAGIASYGTAGGYSGDGGAATAAQLANPSGVCLDASGNIYIADLLNSRIRKVNTSGTISTVAGKGTGYNDYTTRGYNGDGGAATALELNLPNGVAVDASGNIYIADWGNARIRKVNSSGIISTVAGNGTAGYTGDGAAATAAELYQPADVLVDGIGNIYFPDQHSNTVRKVNTSGIISTLAGNGTIGYSGDGGAATASVLSAPTGVAFDADGNLYIADYGNYRIRMINTLGIISTIAGNGTYTYSGDGSPATAAGFVGPIGVAFDAANNMYVSDYNGYRIREISTVPLNTAACSGLVTNLGDALAGGTWSSSNTAVGTISSAGVFGGVAVGTSIITYNSAGCVSTVTMTVNAVPAAIGGTGNICSGTAAALTDGTSSGAWSSGNTAVGTISSGGSFFGVSAGTAAISYTLLGCSATGTMTVTSAGIVGVASVCLGSTTNLSGSGGAGTWATSNAAVAGISSGGVLSGVSAGTANITYTLSGIGCTMSTVATVTGASFTISANPACTGVATTFASGAPLCSGTALGLNGTSTLGAGPGLISTATNSITMEAWVNWNGTTSTNKQIIMSNGNSAYSGYALFHKNGLLKVVLGSGLGVVTMTSGYTLTANTWAHVALVCSASDVWTMYVNGVATTLTSSSSVPTAPSTSPHPGGFYVGDDPYTTGLFFNGSIDGAAFWTTARTAAQVGSDMEACSIAPQTGLAGYWSFNEASGSTAYDGSGNGNNLTLTGASWVANTQALSTYSWNFGDGVAGAQNTISHTYTVAATYTPTLVVTNENGCNNQATMTLSVNPVPAAIGGATGICVSSNATLTDAVGTGAWSSSNTAVGSISSSGVFGGVSAGTAIITYNISGCTPVTTTMTVNVLPAVTASSAVICSGSPATLSASGATGYTWVPASGLSSTISATPTASPTITTTYTVTGTNTTTGCSGVTTAAVTVNALPSASFTASVNPVCAGVPTTFVSGAPLCSGTALGLNGTSGVGTATGLLSTATNSITMEAWVNWNGSGGATNQMIMSNGNSAWTGYTLYQESGLIKVVTGDVVIMTSGYTLTPGAWTHVALVCSATDVWTLYVNGTSVGLTPNTATPFAPSTSPHPAGFYIGDDPYTANQFFNGTIDGAMFWTTARTATQVAADMIACDIAPQAGLVGYWPFNEGTGTTAYDASGNGNNLALTGTTWVTATEPLSTYAWNFGDGAAATVNNVAHTYSLAATYTPTLIVTNSNGCSAQSTSTVLVNPVPATITGVAGVCTGASLTLADATGAGNWSSGNTSVGTVGGASGVFAGISAGTTVVTYSVSGCAALATVTVNQTPAISGLLSVPVGAGSLLHGLVTGGSWTSASTGVASIGSTSGLLSGVSAGTSSITYSRRGCLATATATVTPTRIFSWFSPPGGGDASVTANWWSNSDSSGYQPVTFATAQTNWVIQSNMTASAQLTFVGNIVIDSGGTFTPLASSVTTVGGNWKNMGGSFVANGGTVLFTGADSANTADTISTTTASGLTGSNSFYHVSFSPSASYTFVILSPVTLLGNFNNASASSTVLLGNVTLTIGGNWNNAGTITGSSRHITMNGTGGPFTATGGM